MRILREYLKAIIALVILGILLWLQAIYEVTSLPGSAGQMEPAISAGSIYLLDGSAHSVRDFAHEEIVFFSFKTDKGSETFVSRVVGLPGERIGIDDGRLLRNGQEVDELYLPQPSKGLYLDEIVIPRDCLFVLNDVRDSTNDSRSMGPIPWTAVFGRTTR